MEEIEILIAGGKTEHAIKMLLNISQMSRKQKEHILQHSSRIAHLNEQNQLGLLAHDNYSIERSKINKGLIETINAIKLYSKENNSSSDNAEYFIQKLGKEVTPEDLLKIRAQEKQGFRDFYLYRPYLDDILLKHTTRYQSVIIKGKPLAGKSRAILHLIQTHFPNEQIWFPKQEDFSTDIKLSFISAPTICVFNDLDQYQEYDNFDYFIQQLLHQRNCRILATCRSNMYHIVEDFLGEQMEYFEVLEVPALNEKEKKEVAATAPIRLHHDDTIGSFFVPIQAMKTFYKKDSSEFEKEILRSYKCVSLFANKNYCGKLLIQDYCEKRYIFFHGMSDKNIAPKMWFDAYNHLQSLGLIQNFENRIYIEETYLDQIIAPNESIDSLVNEIITYYPTVETYTKLIRNYRNWEKGIDLFKRMLKNNISPDVITFTPLINSAPNYRANASKTVNLEKAS